MAYNVLPEVSAGDRWTAADVNTYFRDNFAAAVPDIFTAKGDLAAASAADAAGAVAVGSNNAVLFADSTATLGVSWGIVAHTKVNDPNEFNLVPTAPATKITELDNEYYDTASAFASDRFTAPHPGYFLVTLMMQWGSGILTSGPGDFGLGPGERIGFKVYKNGSEYCTIAGLVWMGALTSAAQRILSCSGTDVVYLDRNDYIEFYFFQNAYSGSMGLSEQPSVNPNAEDVSHHISITALP